jgi:hypothetical protein
MNRFYGVQRKMLYVTFCEACLILSYMKSSWIILFFLKISL